MGYLIFVIIVAVVLSLGKEYDGHNYTSRKYRNQDISFLEFMVNAHPILLVVIIIVAIVIAIVAITS